MIDAILWTHKKDESILIFVAFGCISLLFSLKA